MNILSAVKRTSSTIKSAVPANHFPSKVNFKLYNEVLPESVHEMNDSVMTAPTHCFPLRKQHKMTFAHVSKTSLTKTVLIRMITFGKSFQQCFSFYRVQKVRYLSNYSFGNVEPR